MTEPVVAHLASVIDREFERREETVQSPYEFVAEHLGVTTDDLVVITEDVDTLLAASVGVWLLETHKRQGGPFTGGSPRRPPASELVQGAAGDVYGYRSVTVVLPAGVLHRGPVGFRVVRAPFEHTVELMAARADAEGLQETFSAFVRERGSVGSPFRGGAYRVDAHSGELALSRWTAPAVSRDSLRFPAGVWETVDRGVHRVLELADQLNRRGLGSSSGVLLVGPPGTGKTQLGMVLARELLGRVTILVPGAFVAASMLTDLFDVAAKLSPSMVLVDDLDLIAGERGATNPHALREFLNVMDGGLADRSGVVVIASTNDHRKIDRAAQRASRFDTVIRLDPPSYDGRLAILQRYLDWCETELDLPAVASATDGATGADLKELVRAAVLETNDAVTTEALLDVARTGRWRASTPAPGVYL